MSKKEKRKSITSIIITSISLIGIFTVSIMFVSSNTISENYFYKQIVFLFIFVVFTISNSYLINCPDYTSNPLNKYSFDTPDDLSKIKYEQIDDFINYQKIIDEYKELSESKYYISFNDGYLMIGLFFIMFNTFSLTYSDFNLIEILLLDLSYVILQVLVYNLFKLTNAYIPSKDEKDFNNGFEKFNLKQCQNYGTTNSDKTDATEKYYFFMKIKSINNYIKKLLIHKEYSQHYCKIICVILMLVIMILLF